jgi:hypothetical protein
MGQQSAANPPHAFGAVVSDKQREAMFHRQQGRNLEIASNTQVKASWFGERLGRANRTSEKGTNGKMMMSAARLG